MKIIEMNKRGRYSHTLFGHKVVRLLLAASLQCGLFVPYVFGDNNLHINIMNQDGVVSGLVRDATECFDRGFCSGKRDDAGSCYRYGW